MESQLNIIKEIAYKVLEITTGGRGVARMVDDRPIRFPARWSRYYSSEYDPATFEFLEKNLKEGDTVLDIGAHIGLFSVAMASMVGDEGRVFCFEPTPLTREVLSKVIALNGCAGNVEVRGEAVSARSGSTLFYETDVDVSNANSLVKTEIGKKPIEVAMTSVDEFAKERGLTINCLKIDVEGAEMDVLTGARDTFLNQRPVARLGLHPQFIVQNGQSLDDIWRILAEYKLQVLFDGKPVEKEWFCSQSDLFDVNLIPS